MSVTFKAIARLAMMAAPQPKPHLPGSKRGPKALLILPALFGFVPATARACAACYGQSDSPLAQGMAWGILTLLVVVLGVLGGIAAFFVYLARKSALQPAGGGTPSDL